MKEASFLPLFPSTQGLCRFVFIREPQNSLGGTLKISQFQTPSTKNQVKKFLCCCQPHTIPITPGKALFEPHLRFPSSHTPQPSLCRTSPPLCSPGSLCPESRKNPNPASSTRRGRQGSTPCPSSFRPPNSHRKWQDLSGEVDKKIHLRTGIL